MAFDSELKKKKNRKEKVRKLREEKVNIFNFKKTKTKLEKG